MRQIIVFSILILFFGCKNTESYKSQILTFDLTKISVFPYIQLSNLGVKEIEYIPLETKEECLISDINEIKTGNDFYLVKSYGKILKFDKNGIFNSQIGKIGKGPQEYQNANDFGINKNNGDIYVLSRWENKFYIFSNNGKFIKTIQSPTDATNMKFTKDFLLCYSMNNTGEVKNSFELVTFDGRLIKSFPNKYMFQPQPNSFFFETENIFYEFNEQIISKEMYSDTIYIFDNMSFTPRFVLFHGDKLLKPEIRQNSSLKYINENYITQRRLLEFGDKIYYEFSLNGVLFCFLGSKEKNNQILVKQNIGFVNDIDGGPNIEPKANKDDYTIISWISAVDFKVYVGSDQFKNSMPKYPKKKKELEKLANSLNENDNPVLILVKLKE